MSDDQDDGSNEPEDAKGLRKLLNDALAAKKEAEDRAAAAELKVTDQKLTGFLSAKQVNPKVAKYIKADGVDATDPAALETWLNENSDLFGGSVGSAGDDAGGDNNSQQQAQEPDPLEVQAWKGIQAASAQGAQTVRNKFDAVDKGLKADATKEEVRVALVAGGL